MKLTEAQLANTMTQPLGWQGYPYVLGGEKKDQTGACL